MEQGVLEDFKIFAHFDHFFYFTFSPEKMGLASPSGSINWVQKTKQQPKGCRFNLGLNYLSTVFYQDAIRINPGAKRVLIGHVIHDYK